MPRSIGRMHLKSSIFNNFIHRDDEKYYREGGKSKTLTAFFKLFFLRIIFAGLLWAYLPTIGPVVVGERWLLTPVCHFFTGSVKLQIFKICQQMGANKSWFKLLLMFNLRCIFFSKN